MQQLKIYNGILKYIKIRTIQWFHIFYTLFIDRYLLMHSLKQQPLDNVF